MLYFIHRPICLSCKLVFKIRIDRNVPQNEKYLAEHSDKSGFPAITFILLSCICADFGSISKGPNPRHYLRGYASFKYLFKRRPLQTEPFLLKICVLVRD